MDYLDYNKDGRIDVEDLHDFILDLMKKQEKNILLSGNDKKINVLNSVKAVLGKSYERYAPMISLSIDWIHTKFVKKKCPLKLCC